MAMFVKLRRSKSEQDVTEIGDTSAKTENGGNLINNYFDRLFYLSLYGNDTLVWHVHL